MSYLIWLGLFSAGILGYLVLGRDAWYFQLLRRGFAPDQARQLAMNYGQELFPGGSALQSLRSPARLWQTWALAFVYFTTFGDFLALAKLLRSVPHCGRRPRCALFTPSFRHRPSWRNLG